MYDRMLQDSLRCYRETGRGVCGDSGPGVGWEFGSRRGVGMGIQAPGAGWGFGLRARGVDSGPGREVGWGFGPRARGGDSGPGAEWELFGVRWKIFYLFAVFSPFR